MVKVHDNDETCQRESLALSFFAFSFSYICVVPKLCDTCVELEKKKAENKIKESQFSKMVNMHMIVENKEKEERRHSSST